MKIESIEFVRSVVTVADVPQQNLPVLAFAGRSNVGKSTWINTLAGRDMARISRTPGKTRCLNYFLVNRSCFWVDLPGYGYAKVSQRERREWKSLVEDWFSLEHAAILVLLIVDMSIPIQASDRQMAEWLAYYRLPFVILANKADRLRSSERTSALEAIRSSKAFAPAENVLAVSGKKKEGHHLIREILRERGLT